MATPQNQKSNDNNNTSARPTPNTAGKEGVPFEEKGGVLVKKKEEEKGGVEDELQGAFAKEKFEGAGDDLQWEFARGNFAEGEEEKTRFARVNFTDLFEYHSLEEPPYLEENSRRSSFQAGVSNVGQQPPLFSVQEKLRKITKINTEHQSEDLFDVIRAES